MNETVKTEERALAPDETREDLLSEAFRFLSKLSAKQLSEIMEGLK